MTVRVSMLLMKDIAYVIMNLSVQISDAKYGLFTFKDESFTPVELPIFCVVIKILKCKFKGHHKGALLLYTRCW